MYSTLVGGTTAASEQTRALLCRYQLHGLSLRPASASTSTPCFGQGVRRSLLVASVLARFVSRQRRSVCVVLSAAKRAKKTAADYMPPVGVPDVDGVDKRRCRRLNDVELAPASGESSLAPVIYWMSRDQRCEDNWALLYAAGLAKQRSAPLHVAFCLVPRFLDATIRHFDFMLRGLQEVESALKALKIPFHLRIGMASAEVPKLCEELGGAAAVVCDMSPLRVPAKWSADVAVACGSAKIPVFQVDAHNVIPVWVASDKQEYAARTIRPKIMVPLHAYLTAFPAMEAHPYPAEDKAWPEAVDWEAAEKSLEVDRTVLPVPGFKPGFKAAKALLELFCAKRLKLFADKRNDPNADALSGLSPYLHFGQISAQRCALQVKQAGNSDKTLAKSCESFIEESVVRRELSDNFCFYNANYDSLEGASGWAQETLIVHEGDKREHNYSRDELEKGRTHDDLWNASQLQLVKDGKMHGFLRMYWAKKILEWTTTPKEALATAIWLNDKYSLDGRDPNGYVGCMWSICGIHDMGWKEREVFGKIRFMNYAGCKRKLNITAFVDKYPEARDTAPAASPKKKARSK